MLYNRCFLSRFNQLLFITVTFISLNSNAAGDFIGAPSQDTISLCQIYDKLANDLGCGDENYLISFGAHYCNKYQAIEQTFPLRTQEVLSRIRACLIQSLVDENNLSCENVQEKAANHHIKCYLESGFCQISKWDKVRLAKVALPALTSRSLRKSLFEINNACQEQN